MARSHKFLEDFFWNISNLVPHLVPHLRHLRHLCQKCLTLRHMECDLISSYLILLSFNFIMLNETPFEYSGSWATFHHAYTRIFWILSCISPCLYFTIRSDWNRLKRIEMDWNRLKRIETGWNRLKWNKRVCWCHLDMINYINNCYYLH